MVLADIPPRSIRGDSRFFFFLKSEAFRWHPTLLDHAFSTQLGAKQCATHACVESQIRPSFCAFLSPGCCTLVAAACGMRLRAKGGGTARKISWERRKKTGGHFPKKKSAWCLRTTFTLFTPCPRRSCSGRVSLVPRVAEGGWEGGTCTLTRKPAGTFKLNTSSGEMPT